MVEVHSPDGVTRSSTIYIEVANISRDQPFITVLLELEPQQFVPGTLFAPYGRHTLLLAHIDGYKLSKNHLRH